MQWRLLVLIPLTLLATACTSKYPYPPQYVSSEQVSPRSIPQPPARFTAEYNREVDAILDLQSHLSREQLAAMKHEDHISPDKILLPVLGPDYTAEHFPVLYAFLNRVASDSWRIGDDARDYWQSPRPWYTEPRVALHVEPIYSYGYPSGHTTTFGSWAYVMADMLPQKRNAFFAQAWSVAGNRIGGGAHYPHDIEGGKKLAAAVYKRLQGNADYQRDFAAAKAELLAGSRVKRVRAPHCRH